MTGECHHLSVTDLHAITATYSVRANGITSLEFIQEGNRKTFGKISEKNQTWTFIKDEPLIGFFGKVGQNGITQIGILNKRIDCNEQKQEVVNEEKSKLTLILIEKSDYLAIAGGVLALILLMICVKACDRNDNRV